METALYLIPCTLNPPISPKGEGGKKTAKPLDGKADRNTNTPSCQGKPTSPGDEGSWGEVERVIPPYNVEIIRQLRHFIVEEVRTARRFLRQVDREFPINESTFYEMGKHAGQRAQPNVFEWPGENMPGKARHTDADKYAAYLKPIEEGISVGVISEAGCPAVADPGADIVAIAQRRGMKVVPLVGPSSMILAVMASGLNGQSFAFNGYLPIDSTDRAKRLKQLETRAQQEHQTQLFIETPYRNHKLFETLLHTLRPQTRLCIAAGITTQDEWIRTHTVAEWKKQTLPDLSKIPAIFLFL